MISCSLLLQSSKSELLWDRTLLRRGIGTPSPITWAHQPHPCMACSTYNPRHGFIAIQLNPPFSPSSCLTCLFTRIDLLQHPSWEQSLQLLHSLGCIEHTGVAGHLLFSVQLWEGREKVLAREKGLSQLWWDIGKQIKSIIRCVWFGFNSFFKIGGCLHRFAQCNSLFWPRVNTMTWKSTKAFSFPSRSEAQHCPPASVPLPAFELKAREEVGTSSGWVLGVESWTARLVMMHSNLYPIPCPQSLTPSKASSYVPWKSSASGWFTVRGFVPWCVIKPGLLVFFISALQFSLTPWQPYSTP